MEKKPFHKREVKIYELFFFAPPTSFFFHPLVLPRDTPQKMSEPESESAVGKKHGLHGKTKEGKKARKDPPPSTDSSPPAPVIQSRAAQALAQHGSVPAGKAALHALSWRNTLDCKLSPSPYSEEYTSSFVVQYGFPKFFTPPMKVVASGLAGVGTKSTSKEIREKERKTGVVDYSSYSRYLKVDASFTEKELQLNPKFKTDALEFIDCLNAQNRHNLKMIFRVDTGCHVYFKKTASGKREAEGVSFNLPILPGTDAERLCLEVLYAENVNWRFTNPDELAHKKPDSEDTVRIGFKSFILQRGDKEQGSTSNPPEKNPFARPIEQVSEEVPDAEGGDEPVKTETQTQLRPLDNAMATEINPYEVQKIRDNAKLAGYNHVMPIYVDHNCEPFPEGHFGYCEKTGFCKMTCPHCEFVTVGSVVAIGAKMTYTRKKAENDPKNWKTKIRGQEIMIFRRAPETESRYHCENPFENAGDDYD